VRGHSVNNTALKRKERGERAIEGKKILKKRE